MKSARDLMTRDLVTIPSTATLFDALHKLEAAEVRHLPVVNPEGEVVGILSDRDLRSRLVPEDPEDDGGAEVGDLGKIVAAAMEGQMLSAHPHTSAVELAEMMLQHGVGALPIVDGRKHLVGIVSYIDLLKVFHPKGHVVDTMTAEPRTVGLDEPIDVAVDAMQSLEVRHLPVVDADKELVGMLSDRDLGTYVRPEKTRGDTARSETSSLTVSDVMSSDVICVEEDDDLEEVVELLAEHKIGAVPVVDGEGHVSGIVSYVDLLRDLSETPGAVR